MLSGLEGAPDYEGEVKSCFDYLLILLVKFLADRIDGQGSRFPYLKRIEDTTNVPTEGDLQHDLHSFLIATLQADVEKTDVSSGRADIYIPRNGFRIVIELKRSFSEWAKQELESFLVQAVAYHQTDIRLGVLGVLDLSDRPPGVPHLDQCFEVVNRTVKNEPDRISVIMRVPGNVKTPSRSK